MKFLNLFQLTEIKPMPVFSEVFIVIFLAMLILLYLFYDNNTKICEYIKKY